MSLRSSKLKLQVIFAIVLAAGCAGEPVAYVGLYGDYESKQSVVSKILDQFAVEMRILDSDPPSGIRSSAIIHGRSKAATDAANHLAYALYKEFGSWVAVRPITITNHEYSPDYIGIYLARPEYLAELADTGGNALAVVPTNSYVAQTCDDFAVVLELKPPNGYTIVGSQFDDGDKETRVSIAGTYLMGASELALQYKGRVANYRREQVQYSRREPMLRQRFTAIRPVSSDSVFGCSFLQDLDVVVRK